MNKEHLNATAPAFVPGKPSFSSPYPGGGGRGTVPQTSLMSLRKGSNLKSEEWRICWNFNSPRGCRWGDKCRWSHDVYDRQVNHPMTGRPLLNTPNKAGGVN